MGGGGGAKKKGGVGRSKNQTLISVEGLLFYYLELESSFIAIRYLFSKKLLT